MTHHGILAAAVTLAGCASVDQVGSRDLLADAMTAEREAHACYQSIASADRYASIGVLLPLDAPYRASVAQMANTRTATAGEVRALSDWTRDMQTCRRRVANYLRQNSPTSLAPVLSAWTDEDEVFVGVVQRKLSWGTAATRLRTIQISLLSKLTDRAIQLDAQFNSARQAELSRRVAVFDALTNLAP